MIAVHGEAIRIDVFSPDMVQCLQRLFDRYHHSMVVHGYKEHAHLLGSIGVELPEPLFDTKLAGYLAHPDFHADTLEQVAAHFWIRTSKHKPKPRHRGPWTSTSLRKTIPRTTS